MSDLSELLHGHTNTGQFLAKVETEVLGVIGVAVSDDDLDGAADQMATMKARVVLAIHPVFARYGIVGAVAETLADGLINSIFAAIEAAAHVAGGQAKG